ncbi:MAG TPA: phosphate ABC transporter substrate-binding protein [Ruminococcaceae bacterium]|nr:phosphate ABC transporter substrate-binding protein [Oscillospiraceae bacterium]
MKMRNILAAVLSAGFIAASLTGCAGGERKITVVSREDGSGTRSAFVELMEVVDADGKDATTASAEINNSTNGVMMSVSGNPDAIGYISLGSLNDTVKAVKVDGVEASADNVKNGAYAVARPFEICYKEENLDDLAKDFISFIMSKDGQQIIADNHYIAVNSNASYTPAGLKGTISVNGSTSVGPVMEKLAAKYQELNSGAVVQIQQTGSGAGITAVTSDACNIGMSSRALKQAELDKGLTELKIADDGIAVIVHKDNKVDNLTSEQIKKIYLGELKNWSEIK